MKRVFQIDITKCGKCGGDVKVIAAIIEKKVIEKILTHLGLPSVAPPIHLAVQHFDSKSKSIFLDIEKASLFC